MQEARGGSVIAFLKRSTGIFLTDTINTILAIAAGVILARQLGPDLRGYFGTVVFAFNLITTFGHLGLAAAIAYHTGKNLYPRQQMLGFLIISAFVVGTAALLAFYFIYPLFQTKWNDIDRRIILIGILGVPFVFIVNFLGRYFLSMLMVLQSNIVRTLRFFLYLLLIILLLWYMGGSLNDAVISFTLAIVIAGILGLIFAISNIGVSFKINSSLVKNSLKFGLKIYMINSLTFLNRRVDNILIQHYLPISAFGFYQIAVNIAERLWRIPDSLGNILFPTLLAEKKNSMELTTKVCRHTIFVLTLFSIPILIFVKLAVRLLYGEDFLPVAPALYSIIIGIVAAPIYRLIKVDFTVRNRLGTSIMASVVALVVNIGANLILIPRLGIVGAGLATSLSYTIMSAILVFFFMRHYNIGLWKILIISREDLKDYKNLIIKIKSRFGSGGGENTNQP